jgi:hypothetical protein
VLTLKMLEGSEELECKGCSKPFRRVRGVFYEGEDNAGVYTVDLHFGDPRYAIIAMAAPSDAGRPTGVVCRLWTKGDQYQVGLIDPPPDPYFQENFGEVLTRREALAHPLKETFFHLTDHVCDSDLRVQQHFSERLA